MLNTHDALRRWNDEGETQWFTYTWWNQAQAAAASQALPGQRFWTINRAFQPGMQRFPVRLRPPLASTRGRKARQDCAERE